MAESMQGLHRTCRCAEVTTEMVGKEVTLMGWVAKARNKGGLVFVDLRDRSGIMQLIFENGSIDEEGFTKAGKLRSEFVIAVTGTVEKRGGAVNENLATGEIELRVKSLRVLAEADVPPFPIEENSKTKDEIRLKYRYLDLRRPVMQNKILTRHKITRSIREYLDSHDFVDIETPYLNRSTPEGARDFLVPSRVHHGDFYALPQSPQLFKQLLMVSGFDKYFQIAPCFRDEDPRADRAPGEFYQLDFEMSFATQEDVFKVVEDVIPYTFKKFTNWKVDEGPFIRIPYREAMEKYGIDKPDLRNPLIIQDVTKVFENIEFNAFKDKTVKAIVVPDGAEQGRKFFDKMTEFATTDEVGAKGLAWTKFEKDGTVQGGIAKFITDEAKAKLENEYGVKAGDSIFFIADEFHKAQKIAGLVRIELGKRLNLLEKDTYRFCFIVDFPMYELSDEGTIDFCHNPFSMPQGGLDALESKDPLDILAYQFDLVCNGYETMSGAVRNHDPEIMVKAFEIAGYTEEDVKNRFGALYNAFQYGTPPHAGAAPGVDRMVMLIADSTNIREVIAFPKNKKARDLLMRAPSVVTKQQLDDVHISIKED